MKTRYHKLNLLLITVIAVTRLSTAAAHLMDVQQGTLNFLSDGAYMVLSLPLTAFEGIDEDKNGSVSILEFNRQRAAILTAIRSHVALFTENEKYQLDGLRLAPQLDHDGSVDKLANVVVLGRFSYDQYPHEPSFRISLFGQSAAEQTLEIAITRQVDGYRRIHTLTPESSTTPVF